MYDIILYVYVFDRLSRVSAFLKSLSFNVILNSLNSYFIWVYFCLFIEYRYFLTYVKSIFILKGSRVFRLILVLC